MATSIQAPETGSAGRGTVPAGVVTRKRRLWAKGLLIFAVVFTALCALLVASSYKDDLAIDSRPGKAQAEVLVTELRRTLVSYTTPDGEVHTPSNGVQYPSGLKVGDVVRVEYDSKDPELVRVAGRSATLTVLPVGTTALAVWLICLALRWWLRRPRQVR